MEKGQSLLLVLEQQDIPMLKRKKKRNRIRQRKGEKEETP